MENYDNYLIDYNELLLIFESKTYSNITVQDSLSSSCRDTVQGADGLDSYRHTIAN